MITIGESVRIFLITTESRSWGLNWASYKIAARTADEAIKKAKKEFSSRERLQEIELLASTDSKD